jgi:glycosyltransferase involved in cell wall biosynthesis
VKIVVVSEWFSPAMGYAENFLPMALGRAGHDVHLLTSDFQVYATSPDYDEIYREKLGEKQLPCGVSAGDGFLVHRFRGRQGRFGITIPDLPHALEQLAPDIVYCFEINCPTTVQVARLRKKLQYKIFCESRLHASIFQVPTGWVRSLMWAVKNKLLGTAEVVSNVHCFYPVAPDVMTIITAHLGVPVERCKLSSLAVETQIFSPLHRVAEEHSFREKMGIAATDLVCVYTGRFTSDKGPLVLARAIADLQARGHSHVRGLFVGQGDERYVEQLAACTGCVVHPFVSPHELANIYRASDIGVWPLQESTSQLDAMACGLPVIVNDTVLDPMRLGEGSMTFRKDDSAHLASRILELQNPDRRRDMGAKAAARMLAECSWDALALKRIKDFEAAVATSTAAHHGDARP